MNSVRMPAKISVPQKLARGTRPVPENSLPMDDWPAFSGWFVPGAGASSWSL